MMLNTTSRILVSRMTVAMRPATATTTARAFSNCEPVERIRGVLEEYRLANFSDELPSRFKKHVISAVQDPNNSNDDIQVESLNQILENIGRSDACLSVEDQNLVLKEAGIVNEDVRSIPVSKMLLLIK